MGTTERQGVAIFGGISIKRYIDAESVELLDVELLDVELLACIGDTGGNM